MSLDLETGDEERAEEIGGERRRRRGRPRKDESSGGGSTKSDSGLKGQIETVFHKIADQLESRDDDELAVAIREESTPMAQGLVSATSTAAFLRPPLLLLLALIEPLLAFWRVGRILFLRFLERRQRQFDEAQAQAGQEPSPVGEYVEGTFVT